MMSSLDGKTGRLEAEGQMGGRMENNMVRTEFVVLGVERKGRFHRITRTCFWFGVVLSKKEDLGRGPDIPSPKMPWNESLVGTLQGTFSH